MQARLSFVRFPSTVVAVAFALMASLVLGGVLGYTIKPPITIPGPTRIVYVYDAGTSGAQQDQCSWINHHKAC